jgi:hypothetical protein
MLNEKIEYCGVKAGGTFAFGGNDSRESAILVVSASLFLDEHREIDLFQHRKVVKTVSYPESFD